MEGLRVCVAVGERSARVGVKSNKGMRVREL
jgi:hypothetical protein